MKGHVSIWSAVFLGETKVNKVNFRMRLAVQNNVLEFQVAVNEAKVVEHLNAAQKLKLES